MTEIKNCTNNFFPELCAVNVVVNPTSTLGVDDDRILLIGQVGTGATAPTNAVSQVVESTRIAAYGADSMLNQMINRVRESCPTAEIFAYTLPNSGTAGVSTITIIGVPSVTTPGIVYVFVNGAAYSAAIDPTVDTNASIAASLQAAILSNTQDPTLSVTVASNVITVTSLIKGKVGGFLDVRTVWPAQPLLTTTPGVTVTVATTAATGNPNLAGVAALTQGFEFVGLPYNDLSSVSNVATYLCAQWTGGARSRAFGVAYGTDAALISLGQSTNNAFFSFMGIQGSRTAPAAETADYVCAAYRRLNCQSSDIAAGFTGTPQPNMIAPDLGDRFSAAQNAALDNGGIGYYNINRVNDVTIGRAVTTYTVANNGTLDSSLHDVNAPSVIACIARRMQDAITAKYTGWAFRADGIVGSASTRVVTIPGVKSFLVGLAQQLSDDNLVQDIPGFIQTLTVRSNPTTGCIDISVDPVLVRAFCCATIALNTI
jgi:phage tail sheath gpL-like